MENEIPKQEALDASFEKLIFIETVEKGLVQLDAGITISHENVKLKVKEWQKQL